MTNAPAEAPHDAPAATPGPDEQERPRRLLRALDRATNAVRGAYATQLVARGYFPDLPSAMLFVKEIDPREGIRPWQAIWRMLRLRRPTPES